MNYATQPLQPNQSNNTHLEFQSPELLPIPTPSSQETPITPAKNQFQQQLMDQQMNTTNNVVNGVTSGL